MADGDLYAINLDPGIAGVRSVPNASAPSGSIGGSNVGANEEDDQRVRDLMQQFLNDSSVLEMLNNLLIINNPNISSGSTGMLYEGGSHATGYQIVTQLANPHANSGSTGVTSFCPTYTTADPKWVHFSCEMLLSWNSIAAGFPTTGRVSIELYTDGVFFGEIIHEFIIASTNSETLTFTITGDFFLGHGVALANPALSVAAQTPLVAVGLHDLQVDAAWLVLDIQDGTFDFQVKNVHCDIMAAPKMASTANLCPD